MVKIYCLECGNDRYEYQRDRCDFDPTFREPNQFFCTECGSNAFELFNKKLEEI